MATKSKSKTPSAPAVDRAAPLFGAWHCVWKVSFGHNSMLVSAPGRWPGNVIDRHVELVASARAAHGPGVSLAWEGIEFIGAVCVPNDQGLP